VDGARVGARELVAEIHSIHTRAALIRWGSAGAVAAATLFGELSVSVRKNVCRRSETKADGSIPDLEEIELQDWIERGHGL
jgi:hypothetical protein